MSPSNRAASKSGKGAKTDKPHKSDKSERGKSGEKQQHKDTKSKNEDPSIGDKVKMLMEMSQRTEEEVCLALHECDYDAQVAINMLLETVGTGNWETRVKKKKNRQTSAGGKDGNKQDAGGDTPSATGGDEWGTLTDGQPVSGGGADVGGVGGGGQGSGGKGGRGGGRGGRRGGGGGGWRGREQMENERNLEDGHQGGGGGGGGYRGDRRGRQGGGPRGGGVSARGRGGGRAGAGRYPPRGGNRSAYKQQPIDTWDNSNTWDNSTATNTNHADETWDDFPGADEWSTEEYQGSLADTKVFTPSVQQAAAEMAAATAAMASAAAAADAAVVADVEQQLQQEQVVAHQPIIGGVNTLTAAQSQYFSQLQQGNDMTKTYGAAAQSSNQQQQSLVSGGTGTVVSAAGPVPPSQYMPQQYQSAYTPGGYGGGQDTKTQSPNAGVEQGQQANQQQQRTKTQRARVPPPSKIPSSAVEMPGGELNGSIGYLDVQFGAMDLIAGDAGGMSFDSAGDSTGKYSNSLDSTATAGAGLDLNGPAGYATTAATAQKTTQDIGASLSQGLSTSTSGAGGDGSGLSSSVGVGGAAAGASVATSDTFGSGYTSSGTSTSRPASSALSSTAASAMATTSMASTSVAGGLDMKQSTVQAAATDYVPATAAAASTFGAYQPTKSSQPYGAQTAGGYNSAQTTVSSYSTNSSSYANQSSYSVNAAGSYPNTYSSNSSYQSQSQQPFPSIGQATNAAAVAAAAAAAAAYQPTAQQSSAYSQNASQSVYGANTGLSNSSSYTPTTSSVQYNSYGGGSSGKMSKEYDTGGGSSGQTSAAANATGLSLSQSSAGKTTASTLAKNSNSVVSSIPPGVTPVMSTPYIMGQVPYFQQPVYSYEEMQLLQQRLPHMTTPYYDISYQTPPPPATTLAAVREAALGGYSMSDGRFARAGDSASPVPTAGTGTGTQGGGSQVGVSGQNQSGSALGGAGGGGPQAQSQAQPILAAATGAAPPYFFTAFNAIPNYQFSTMYTQLPAAAAANSTGGGSQYGGVKPGPYPSGPGAASAATGGYGGYEALNQAAAAAAAQVAAQEYKAAAGGYAPAAVVAAQAAAQVAVQQKAAQAAVVAAQQAANGTSPAGAAGAQGQTPNDLTSMYAKSHTALGKVNSYEKQGFHSGTPPPFAGTLHGGQSATATGLAPSGAGYAPQVYIPTMAPHQQQHHSSHLMPQQLHQDSSNAGGQRSQGSNQAKAGSKQPYQTSYWNQA